MSINTLLLPLKTLDDVEAFYLLNNKGDLVQNYLRNNNDSFYKIIEYIQKLEHDLEIGSKKINNFTFIFEKALIYLYKNSYYKLYIKYNTSKPSLLSIVLLKDITKKLDESVKLTETIIDNTIYETKDEDVIIQLNEFLPIVDYVTKYYGPAARLMIKKALKNAGATNEGISKKNLFAFLNNLENEIIDNSLREPIITTIKEKYLKDYLSR